MLQIFKNESFGEIRTVTIDGEPWFVGKDVCNALKYTNSRDAIRAHVSPEHVQTARVQTAGGRQNLKVVDKSGFACLITQNRKMTWEQKEEALNSIGLDFQSIGLHFVPDEIKQEPQAANAEILNIKGVRCYEENQIAYLNLEDVSRGLGFIEPTGTVRWARVKEYLKGVGFFATSGENTYIPENVFYRLAMKASNSTAEKFQAKIADEIIPTIRRHGFYGTPQTIEKMLADPENAIKMLQALQAERTKSQALEAKIETDRPKVEFAEAILTSDACMTVGDFAKKAHESGIDTTERKLFGWMLENQYLMHRYGRGRGAKGYVPTAKSEKMKLFEIDLKTYYTHGKERSSATSLITPKGQEYFIRKLKEQNGKDDRNGILFN